MRENDFGDKIEFSWKDRCGKCKWLNKGKCFDCDMRYSKFDPAHKDAQYMMMGGKL